MRWSKSAGTAGTLIKAATALYSPWALYKALYAIFTTTHSRLPIKHKTSLCCERTLVASSFRCWCWTHYTDDSRCWYSSLMSRSRDLLPCINSDEQSWGANTYWDDARVLPARLEFKPFCETTHETSRPYSLDFNTHTRACGKSTPHQLSPSYQRYSLAVDLTATSSLSLLVFWCNQLRNRHLSRKYPIMHSPHPWDLT